VKLQGEMQTDRIKHKHLHSSTWHHQPALPCCRYVSAMLTFCCVNHAGC